MPISLVILKNFVCIILPLDYPLAIESLKPSFICKAVLGYINFELIYYVIVIKWLCHSHYRVYLKAVNEC